MKKRIVAMFMAIAMVMVMIPSAFAVETESEGDSNTAIAVAEDISTLDTDNDTSESGISPQDVTNLRYISVELVNGASKEYTVTPAYGKNLRITVAVDKNPISIKVTKNGGWWPSKSGTLEVGTHTYNLIENCNGQPYTLKFEANNGDAYLVATVLATDYT